MVDGGGGGGDNDDDDDDDYALIFNHEILVP